MNITLTDKASSRLQEIIKSKGMDLSLRVMVRGGGCSGLEYGMALERNPRADDNILEAAGVKVVVDPGSLEHLDGVVIDFVDSVMGGGFAINNPNATSSCGHAGQAKGCGSGGCSH